MPKVRPALTARFALLLAAISLVGCRQHNLEDGTYQFHLGTVIRDDCQLAQSNDLINRGTIRTAGHKVKMDYEVLGTPLQMVGSYLDQEIFNSTDRMRLDGSAANQTTMLNGQECLLDQVVLHLDSTTTDAQSFSGTFSIDYESARRSACVCQFWFNYSADAVP